MQTQKRVPQDINAFVKRLNPQQKIKALIKYVDNRNVFYAIIAEIGSEMATDQNLLINIGEEYKKMRRNSSIQLEDCWKNQVNTFQALIDFHFKKSLKLKKATS